MNKKHADHLFLGFARFTFLSLNKIRRMVSKKEYICSKCYRLFIEWHCGLFLLGDYQYDMGRNWFEVKQYAGIIFVFSIKISWPI